MATATTAVAVTAVRSGRNFKEVDYTLTINAGDYATGGLTIDFTGATNPKFLAGGFLGENPGQVMIRGSAAGNAPEIVAGTALNNWKLKLFSAANTELTVAALNAAIPGDTNLRLTAISRLI